MKRAIIAVILCFALAGCWDQLELKNLHFVDTIGIDYDGGGKQLKVGYVITALREANQGGGKPSSMYVESTGDNLYEAAARSNKGMPGILSVLETRLYLIGTRFAKDRPMQYLNMASQFITNPFYAYLAMYDGDVAKLLATKDFKGKTVSDFLIGLLEDEKERGRIPPNKLLNYILGGNGYVNDFALNRFEAYEDGVRLSGTALFRDGTYTGVNLNDEDTQLAYLLREGAGENQLLAGQWNGKAYSTLLQHASRRYRIRTNSQGIEEIRVTLKLDVKLIEDGVKDRKYTKSDYAELETAIERDLSAKSEGVIKTLQRANCDYLQLGGKVAAYHPQSIKETGWREQYPAVRVKPEVRVTILNNGILE